MPPRPIRELRDLTRLRSSFVQERTRTAQRLDKVLQDAGIKLSSVASSLLGKSSRAMLAALVEGARDPEALAELAKGKLRKKLPALREALLGRFSDHHGLLIGELLGHLDALEETIARLSDESDSQLRPFATELELLQTVPGFGRRAAEIVIAELGTDMSRFGSHRELASWAKLCPGTKE